MNGEKRIAIIVLVSISLTLFLYIQRKNEFGEYVNSFERDMEVEVNSTIRFGTPAKEIWAGMCKPQKTLLLLIKIGGDSPPSQIKNG